MNTSASLREDTAVELTSDSYAQQVNDPKNKTFIQKCLEMRDGLLYGSIELRFEGGHCVYQTRTVASKTRC